MQEGRPQIPRYGKSFQIRGGKKDQIVGFVYSTKQYSQFKKLDGNRDLDEKNIQRLEQSMLVKQLPIPGVVNEKLEVIDAQHRLDVDTRNGLDFLYICAPGLDVDDCVIANISSKNWSQIDFVKRYAKKDQSYARLLRLIEDFDVSLYTAKSALGKFSEHNEERNAFKEGKYEVTEEMYELARERLLKAKEVLAALESTRDRTLGHEPITQVSRIIEAVIRCQKEEGYDHKRMVAACKQKGQSYVNCPIVADVLKQLQTFYNYGRKKGPYMDVIGNRTSLQVRFDATVRR